MVENRKNTDKIAIQSFTVSRAKWASEQTSEHSGGRERSEQSGASERVSVASEPASRWASGPVLTSRFQEVLNHCAVFVIVLVACCSLSAWFVGQKKASSWWRASVWLLAIIGWRNWIGIGWSIKRFSIKVKKKCTKNEDDLAEKWKLGKWTIPIWCLFLQKNFFSFAIYVADMAILMSDFDNFDNDQISWKLAQR